MEQNYVQKNNIYINKLRLIVRGVRSVHSYLYAQEKK